MDPQDQQNQPGQHDDQLGQNDQQDQHDQQNQNPQNQARKFDTAYPCFPISMLPGNGNRPDVENGGKIFLPPSALSQLIDLNVAYPMIFKLSNYNNRELVTHCGVLEFIADETKCYLPTWMMTQLGLAEGDIVQIETAALPVGTFSKFQPQSTEFLDITNPKAMLENGLRNFSCLTVGDIFSINYNEKIYQLKVMESKPEDAVMIVDCDLNVDFAPPVGYVEPERKVEPEPVKKWDSKFIGTGHRLDGKSENTEGAPAHINRKRGIPDYDWNKKNGQDDGGASITFPRDYKKPKINNGVNDPKPELVPFSGDEHVLLPKKNEQK